METEPEHEPRVGEGANVADTGAPVGRDPETGEQRYPEEDGGTERTAPPPEEADTADEQATGTGY